MEKLNDVERAFLEGFKASGEGYNGEYPFEGETDEKIWESIKDKM